MNKTYYLPLSCLVCSPLIAADDVKDMSDPLAVYSQAGVGITDKGVNIKIGQSYSTSKSNIMAMNIVEIKGIAGSELGWSGNSQRDNAIDSVRLRNFQANLDNASGTQLDLNYSVENESLDASYSYIKALPEFYGLSLFPLVGGGLRVQNERVQTVEGEQKTGYKLPGTFAVAGMYSRYNLADKIWLNYNPMWMTTFSGSDEYKDHTFGKDNSDILLHELSLSYQFTPRLNFRYFANWSEYSSFSTGDQRVEVNYQF